jgi:GT2 family glycosyltransferase
MDPGSLSPKVRSYLSELIFQGEDIDDIGERYIVGANMCYAADVFHVVGLFREQLGHERGAMVRFNDEIEFCRRLSRAGGKVSFLSQAVVWHHIPRGRLSRRYLLKRAYWQGRSDAWLTSEDDRLMASRESTNLKYSAVLTTASRAGVDETRLRTVNKAMSACRRLRRQKGYARVLNLARETGYVVQLCLNLSGRSGRSPQDGPQTRDRQSAIGRPLP